MPELATVPEEAWAKELATPLEADVPEPGSGRELPACSSEDEAEGPSWDTAEDPEVLTDTPTEEEIPPGDDELDVAVVLDDVPALSDAVPPEEDAVPPEEDAATPEEDAAPPEEDAVPPEEADELPAPLPPGSGSGHPAKTNTNATQPNRTMVLLPVRCEAAAPTAAHAPALCEQPVR